MDEMELIESTKPKKKKLSSILSNILFGIVMAILVVFLGYSIGSLSQNKVPSFFGKSYVRILTGSMNASGFKEGDVVMIKKVKLSEIKVGDIIAFYWSPTHSAPAFATNPALNDMETGQSSFDVSIVFHQVAEVRVDTRGNLWVKTYGTSNMNAAGEPSYDGWTKGDHIVGVYEENIFAGIIQFISSTEGIIAIVIVPSCIVLFILLMRIIDILDKMSQEKKKNKQENMDKINEIKGVEDEQEQQDQEQLAQTEEAEIEPPQEEQQSDEEVGENQEQTEAVETDTQERQLDIEPEENQTEQPEAEQQEVEEEIQDEEVEEEFEVEDEEVQDQQPKPKKARKILKKEERDQISQQVDELVEKSKTRKKKTEDRQDV